MITPRVEEGAKSGEGMERSDARPWSRNEGHTEGARGMVRLIRLYQAARWSRPSPCRFLPTCSEYAVEAITSHGALRGGFLAARRISRCRPFGGHGFDPVPARGVSR